MFYVSGSALYSLKPRKASVIEDEQAVEEDRRLTERSEGHGTKKKNGHHTLIQKNDADHEITNNTVLRVNTILEDITEVSCKNTRVVPKVYKRRWIMLIIFTGYSMTNAYQWIHMNIIGNVIKKYYNSSLPDTPYMAQMTIDWLSMVYMLAYIPLIFPVTWLLDRKGLRVVGLAATFLNCCGAWVKCTAVHPDRFILVMFGQTLCAIGQVFILGIPARLAAVWFGHNQVSTATAIGVFGNQASRYL